MNKIVLPFVNCNSYRVGALIISNIASVYKNQGTLSCLGQCPEQTLGVNSAASPTTPRGSLTPRRSNTPRITGSQDPRIPGAWSHQDLRLLEAALLPGALIHLGSQDHRIPESQGHRDSWTLRNSDTTRITGGTGFSQIY